MFDAVPQPNAKFSVGDTAVYPAHGVADVVSVERKPAGDTVAWFYSLQVRGSGLRIIVPVAKADENGMRALSNERDLAEMFALLADQEMPCDRQTWNRRYRGFMEKIRTGSLFEVAEVYRDLSLLKANKSLSHGEKQMLRTARDLLVRELGVARGISDSDATVSLESVFQS